MCLIIFWYSVEKMWFLFVSFFYFLRCSVIVVVMSELVLNYMSVC